MLRSLEKDCICGLQWVNDRCAHLNAVDSPPLLQERHYKAKLGLAGPGMVRGLVEDYVRGLQWVLQYYYRGVASWTWFYPHHYAPLASDITSVQGMQVQLLVCWALALFRSASGSARPSWVHEHLRLTSKQSRPAACLGTCVSACVWSVHKV